MGSIDTASQADTAQRNFCSSCGTAIQQTDAFCSGCGRKLASDQYEATAGYGAIKHANAPYQASRPSNEAGIFIGLLGSAVLLCGGGLYAAGVLPSFGIPLEPVGQKQAERLVDDAKAKVARDTEREYELAARSGNKTDKCVYAGLAAAAYAQAQDSENYGRAVSRRNLDCAVAGIPSR